MFISSETKAAFVADLITEFGVEVSRQQILSFAEKRGMNLPAWLLNGPCKTGRGKYNLENYAGTKVASVSPIRKEITVDYVPQTMKDYVAFGYHSDVQTIIKSGQFYPVFISGLSGNGKTTMVEQICAKLNRECFRVNISVETDEDALVGGHTLVNGNVVYREGPVLTAMRRGAILLLDEIDRGSDKLICLQAILEGKPYLNKKTGETVLPSPGFNVLATANTKGFGSDDGKFSAARVLDEAFLERFAVAIEQDYPSNAVEKKIVLNQMTSKNCVNAEFANYLVNWAEIIRKTYADGGIDYVVSTRRLVNIVDAFAMFGDRMKAIKLCINRFDSETRNAFEELYCKIDDTQNKMTETSEVPTPEVV